MELINIFQKVLKIGEIVTSLHDHEIETAVPNGGSVDIKAEESPKVNNTEVLRLCKEVIGIMSPFAVDMSKVLFDKIG
jgi:hypothetical protein